MTPRHLVLSALLFVSACDSRPEHVADSKAPAAPPAPSNPHAPGSVQAPAGLGEILFTAQPGWTVEAPSSSMRKAQYRLPKADGDAEDGSLVVYYFGASGGGGREANLTRWAGQFEQPDKSDSAGHMKSTERTVNGLAVTDVELSGTYVAETTPGSGERVRKEDWRMLASIVEAPAGAYYAKFVGPSKTVAHWQASYKAFVDAVKTGS